jgi:AcrR family transcriptional regulator
MSRAALSESAIREFRARVIAAATRLFAESGYDAVTMRAIAAKVGCSPMTPYRYFDDKDEIFALVTAGAFRRFADQQRDAIDGVHGAGDKLAALGLAYVRFAVAEPDSYRIVFELRPGPRADHPELVAQGERAWRYMHAAVVEAIEAGMFAGDPQTIAHVFWAGIHGVVSLYLADKLRPDQTIEKLVPAMMAALLAGMAGTQAVSTEEDAR